MFFFNFMNEQQIVSSVCLSRDTQITTALALYDLKTNSIHFFTFKDDFLHFGLSNLIQNEKISTLVVQKELAVIIDLFKGKINLVCVDRKNFNINPRISTGDYFSDSTVSSLLNYLNLNDHRIRELKIVRKHLPGTMYIPKDVITDLELLEKKTHSLLNLVNHTKTRFGLIKLKNNIVQPFANEEKIKQRKKNILFFNENESLAMKIENVLKDIPFTINVLAEDFNTERKTLESLKKVFEDSKKLNKFLLRVFELKDLLHSDLQLFKDFNESVINSKIIEIRDEFAKVFEFNEESIIKQGIDDYLDLARKIHNEFYEDALKITEKLLVDKRFKMIKTPKGIYLKALSIHLIEQPDIIKANKDHSINMLSSFQDENLPEFLNSSYTPSICSLNMSSSKIKEQKDFILFAKNKSYFLVVTKEIYRLNILLNGIHDQIIELEGEIALNLLKNVMKDLPTLIPICENIAEIDVCLSGYYFSQSYDCCIPKIDDFICISRSFYPPLKSSINNDYYVDKENLLNIITGPNMSGKSTYLKQFAYLTILTQIGYPITAKSAITKIFTGLYVSFNSIRIDLECMRELLKYHTSSSLIIIDEPGKGYDVDILTAFYSVLFDKLMITRPTIFFITHHYGIFKLNKCKKLNYLQVEQFKVKFGISKSRTGFKICEENIPKIYLDWL